MSDIFKEVVLDDQDTIDPLKYAAEKFGDGQNVDLGKLAQSKLEADRFIKKLQAEADELRQQVSSKQTMDEIMTQIKQMSAQTPPVNTDSPNPPVVKDEETVEAVVARLLSQKEVESTAARNRRQVEEALQAKWGDDALVNVNKKARELGVSIDQLNKLAVETPQVVLTLLGLDKADIRPAPVVAPRGHQGGIPEMSSPVRTKAWYDRLKATNPTEYFSPKIQNQMMKDAMAQREAFFS